MKISDFKIWGSQDTLLHSPSYACVLHDVNVFHNRQGWKKFLGNLQAANYATTLSGVFCS